MEMLFSVAVDSEELTLQRKDVTIIFFLILTIPQDLETGINYNNPTLKETEMVK